jgi:hypothetical protein
VRGKFFERDGLLAQRHKDVFGRITLERVVEPDDLLLDEFGEHVGGEDLGERAETENRIGGGGNGGVGSGFAVALKEGAVVADNDYDHSDRA